MVTVREEAATLVTGSVIGGQFLFALMGKIARTLALFHK